MHEVFTLFSKIFLLEDKELRNQYFDELKKLKGDNNMAELSWIEERFRDEAVSEGIATGETRGEERAINAAIDFMRSNGMTNEQIDSFRNSFLKS